MSAAEGLNYLRFPAADQAIKGLSGEESSIWILSFSEVIFGLFRNVSLVDCRPCSRNAAYDRHHGSGAVRPLGRQHEFRALHQASHVFHLSYVWRLLNGRRPLRSTLAVKAAAGKPATAQRVFDDAPMFPSRQVGVDARRASR